MAKRSFFEKLTGSRSDDEYEYEEAARVEPTEPENLMDKIEEENEEGQLAVDVYQTSTEIIIQAITPGMKPENLDITLTREMITIQGQRKTERKVDQEDFFYQEVYWGAFSRSILLPQEVDPDEATAQIKEGILTITLPKLDKERTSKLKVKNG